MPVSARTASLREQRTRYVSRKVARPNSLSSRTQSISRKYADAELDDFVNRYNNGLVTNAEFLAALKKAENNSVFTPNDVVQIREKIRDFEVRVVGERLEAVYDNTPKDSVERARAAQELSSFYSGQAQRQEEGTPAQSVSLQKSGEWNQKAATEADRVEKANRKAIRADQFFQIAQIQPGTVEQLEARADAFNVLSQQARQDGDETEAVQFQTQAQNELNKIPALETRIEKSAAASMRSGRLDAFRIIQDAYHDGEITAQDAAGAVDQINRAALEAGDTALITSVNAFADRVQKDIEKGVERGDIEGLPWMKRKTGAGEQELSIREMKAVFSNEDDVFRSGQRLINRIPDAQERMEKLLELHASYIYGAAPTEGDPEGWVGLTDRQDKQSQWAEIVSPSKRYAYENNARDTAAKIDQLEPGLAQVVNQYANVTGIVPNEYAQKLLGAVVDVLPVQFQVPSGLQNEYGIMTTTDKLGNTYEKVIPLNAQVSLVDPDTGATTVLNTYVGRDIMQLEDRNGQARFVKLKPYYAPGSDPSLDYPSFYYTEFEGNLLVRDEFSSEMKPASQFDPDENPEIAEWYQGNIELENGLRQRYAERVSQQTGQEITPEQLLQDQQLKTQQDTKFAQERQTPGTMGEEDSTLQQPGLGTRLFSKAKDFVQGFGPKPSEQVTSPLPDEGKGFQIEPKLRFTPLPQLNLSPQLGLRDVGKALQPAARQISKRVIQPAQKAIQSFKLPQLPNFRQAASGFGQRAGQAIQGVAQKARGFGQRVVETAQTAAEKLKSGIKGLFGKIKLF